MSVHDDGCPIDALVVVAAFISVIVRTTGCTQRDTDSETQTTKLVVGE